VSDQQKWARTPDQYLEHQGGKPAESAKPGAPAPEGTFLPPTLRTREDLRQYEDTGLVWRQFDVDLIRPTEVERARHRFRALDRPLTSQQHGEPTECN
jgi:hypothetical protein